MIKRAVIGVVAAALWIGMLIGPNAFKAEAAMADGTYTADYLVLKAEDDSVSMANDYWEKPATVVIDGDKATIQLSINHSTWVTQFKVPGSGSGYVDTKVLEEKDNVRVVQFTADVTKPIVSKIHVTVPEIDYDHNYTIRLSFDLNSFKLVKAAAPAASESPSPSPSPAASTSPEASTKPTDSSTVAAAKPEASAKPAETTKPAASAQPAETTKPAASSSPEKSDSAASPSPSASASATAGTAAAAEAPSASASSAAASEQAPEASASPSVPAEEDEQGSEAEASGTMGELAAGADAEVAEAAAAAASEAEDGGSNAAAIWTVSIIAVVVLAGAGWYFWRRNRKLKPTGGIGG
ncbi:NEAT domain-containing protein [Cohnella fermenti]|uniref:NEAT domain-containing protein n=1 Tax=Cohnella fermenti TaxID=2565925 RepID=A0A4S4C809_9BACL|nr:NEAT domain-containing protein [Cohnella fermenti]THF83462.1 hypothetical protein E6C55_04690 [Cohnella fermenti]